jgi:hypothetical protein
MYGDDTFAMKVINTGLGLSHHPRFGEKRFFQTFITYQNIPLNNLLERDLWIELFSLHHIPSDNVDKHYELISKLAKGGEKVPASNDRLDYSTAQLQGTCGASPWWSWLRHEIVDVFPEKGDRKIAYAEWRLLKNEIKRTIMQGTTKDSMQDKVYRSAAAKIEKHGQLVKLMDIAADRKLFNETMKSALAMLEQLLMPLEITNLFGDLKKDYLDYENTGSRWHILSETSKRIASEVVLLRGIKRSKFLDAHFLSTSKECYKQFTYLTLLDLETTKNHIGQLLQDSEKQKDWKTIGKTLGRLALDPKLSPIAVRLGKQWLTLSNEAKTNIVDKKAQDTAQETILSHFLYFVSQGKEQDQTLRDLAIHFRKVGNNSLAERFWKEYWKYAGSNLGDIVASDTLAVEDIEIIANTVTTIDDTLTLLLAVRNVSTSKTIQKVIAQLIDKALVLDDKAYSKLKKVTETFYAGHFDYLAETIRQKVQARLIL